MAQSTILASPMALSGTSTGPQSNDSPAGARGSRSLGMPWTGTASSYKPVWVGSGYLPFSDRLATAWRTTGVRAEPAVGNGLVRIQSDRSEKSGADDVARSGRLSMEEN